MVQNIRCAKDAPQRMVGLMVGLMVVLMFETEVLVISVLVFISGLSLLALLLGTD